ncbi:MAG: L,D-transpeptidase family protein [Planctomycetota bacterium]
MPQLKLKKSHRRRPTAAILTTLALAVALVAAVWIVLRESPETSADSLKLMQPTTEVESTPADDASTTESRTIQTVIATPPTPEPSEAAVATPTVRSTTAALDPAFLQQARQLADAGKRVQARTMLNDRLVAGDLNLRDPQKLKQAIAELQQTLILSPEVDPADPLVDVVEVPSGGALARLARPFDVPWQGMARINGIENPNRIRVGQRIKAVRGPFHAVVDKSDFTLDLYLGGPGGPGSTYVTTLPVGLGEDSSTPTGLWRCTTSKVEDPKWTNPRTGEVVAADDPENPLGERWIGLEGIEGDAVGQQSYGIHGTIEPETIGTNASMGCVRLLPDDVALIYDLLKPGESTVRVVE